MVTKLPTRVAKLVGLFIFTTLLTLGFALVTTADVSAHDGGERSLPFNLPACTSRIVVCNQLAIADTTINSEAVREFNIQAAPQIQATPTPGVVDEPNSQHCLDGNGVPRSCDAVKPFTYHRDLKQYTRKLPAPSVAAQNLQPMAETPCVDGFAGEYPCANVDLLSFLPLNSIGGGEGNDIWGWTDPTTEKEYVLMGRTNGTAFVDISNPTEPIYLGNLPSQNGLTTIWRDIKVYQDHAFIVADQSRRHGMQVFDLTQLRQLAGEETTLSATTVYTLSGSAHNIAINEESGFAYIAGTTDGIRCAGGLHIVDIRTPASPTFAGCFVNDGYTHDTQCVIYNGPDSAYQSQEICFNSNEDTLTIVDVTQKDAINQIAREAYSNASYSHQGWLTEDHAYFIQNDELDELFVGNNTRTIIWDVRELSNPQFIGEFTFPFKTVDHNLYVRDNFIYEANYASGLRILDASEIANSTLSEIAYFDTYPAGNTTASVSAWSSYPYFNSGVVAVSTITEGLFILRPNLLDANAPPVLLNPGNQRSMIEESVTLQIIASDREEDALTYDAIDLPDGLAIVPSTGLISGAPTTAQTKNVLILVDDGNGNTSSQNFSWTITGELLLGDANCSASVNIIDAVVIMQYVTGRRFDIGGCPLTNFRNQIYAAGGDVNGDSATNVIDALLILQCEFGVPNSFCSPELMASAMQSDTTTEPASITLTPNSNKMMLTIDPIDGNIAAGSLILEYDSSTAKLVNCASFTNAFCHESQPGVVHIVFAEAGGFTDVTTIVDLTFDNQNVKVNELQVDTLVSRTHQDRTYTINQALGENATQDQQNYPVFVPLINR